MEDLIKFAERYIPTLDWMTLSEADARKILYATAAGARIPDVYRRAAERRLSTNLYRPIE